jgi:SAM-dependent methyltransferase
MKRVNSDRRFEGTLLYLAARWPNYLLVYGGGALIALLFLLVGLVQTSVLWLASGTVLLLLLGYFFVGTLLVAQQRFDRYQNFPAALLFSLAQLQTTDAFAHVGLGRRFTPVRLARRLTSGHLTVIDVYNPQLAPSRVLARERQQGRPLTDDPRLTYLDGSVTLLPLPDARLPTLTLSHTLGELREEGDRLRLLAEVRRVLEPGGQLLLAEAARTRTGLLLYGLGSLRLPRASYWRALLERAGLRVEYEESVAGLYMVLRARKPLPGEAQQLTLDFGL